MLTFAMVMSQTAERSTAFTSAFGKFRLLYAPDSVFCPQEVILCVRDGNDAQQNYC